MRGTPRPLHASVDPVFFKLSPEPAGEQETDHGHIADQREPGMFEGLGRIVLDHEMREPGDAVADEGGRGDKPPIGDRGPAPRSARARMVPIECRGRVNGRLSALR